MTVMAFMTVWELTLSILLLLAVQAALGIVMERRSAVSTWAWLLILILVPVVGLPLYLLFGRQQVKKKIQRGASATRRLTRALTPFEVAPMLTGARVDLVGVDSGTAQLAIGMGGTPIRGCNEVEVLQDGPAVFEAMEKAVRAAERYVHMESFIFNPGQIGERMREALAEAAKRGVEVRLLFDAVGSGKLTRAYMVPVTEAGGRLEFFAPVRFGRFRRRPDFRNHRKILVVDGKVGFVGGINVMDEYAASERPETPWRDTHLRTEGPIVHDLERVLNESWFQTTDEMLITARHLESPQRAGDTAVQIVASGPDSPWPKLEKVYTAAIYAARRRLDLTTPYLVPPETVMSALVAAALRGVKVRLLVPARGDHAVVTLAGRSYYPDLMEAGVRIFEYGPRMVHAKTLSVDGRFAVVGTTNLDVRSFRLNYEVSAFLYDRQVTAQLDEAFATDLASSREIDLARFRRRPYLQKVLQNTARLLSPLL